MVIVSSRKGVVRRSGTSLEAPKRNGAMTMRISTRRRRITCKASSNVRPIVRKVSRSGAGRGRKPCSVMTRAENRARPEVHGAAHDEGPAAVHAGQRNGQGRPRQSSHETGLRAPHQRLRQPLDADLIGQPRGAGAAAEGRSEAPYDRGGEQRVEERDGPREQETGAREGESDDDREAAAVDVGDDAGGNLEGKDRRFEDGTEVPNNRKGASLHAVALPASRTFLPTFLTSSCPQEKQHEHAGRTGGRCPRHDRGRRPLEQRRAGALLGRHHGLQAARPRSLGGVRIESRTWGSRWARWWCGPRAG